MKIRKIVDITKKIKIEIIAMNISEKRQKKKLIIISKILQMKKVVVILMIEICNDFQEKY